MENKKLDKGLAIKVISAVATNDDGNKPESVIDSDYATRWSSDVQGAELTLELEAVSEVAYIGIACYNGDARSTTVGVSVSEDGKSYERVIDKVNTPRRADMTPISLGKVYRAKFVKIHGYGNSSNAWTSITELKVYAPQADGSMPVDPNGPKKKTVEDLPEEIQAALAKVDKYYDRVIPWLAHMYDHKTGGFYMTMSGKLDPEMEPAIEMTYWGLCFINGYARIMDSMPKEIKDKLITFYHERQDPVSGFFIDKQGPVNAREQGRNQMSGIGACKCLGISPKYPHPTLSESKSAADAPLMPDYMASPEKFVEWMETLPWEDGSWHAGDKVESSQHYIKMLPEDKQKEYTDAIFKWLDTHQYESGMWSTKLDFTSISGIYKVQRVYAFWNKRLPRYEQAIDTTFACYKADKLTNPYYVRNPISVFHSLCAYSEDVKERIQRGIIENIEPIAQSFAEFLCPDGAFCASLDGGKKSMKAFGGVVGSHQLHEGDIDATLMMLIARNTLYSIFDMEAPALPSEGFWDYLLGNKPLPEIYEN